MRPLSSLEGSIKPIFEVVLLFLLAPAVISRQTPNISDLSSPSAPSLPSSEGECEKSGLRYVALCVVTELITHTRSTPSVSPFVGAMSPSGDLAYNLGGEGENSLPKIGEGVGWG